MTTVDTDIDNALVWSAEVVAQRLGGISDNLVYTLLDEGVLPEVRLGRRRMIPRLAIELVLERAMEGFDPDAVARRLGAVQ
jgi:excisionase family DNA binding protein